MRDHLMLEGDMSFGKRGVGLTKDELGEGEETDAAGYKEPYSKGDPCACPSAHPFHRSRPQNS